MKVLQAQTVKVMDADIAAKGSKSAKAVATYKNNIGIVWSAMHEPYCGFGSLGISAVKHSYIKSVDHIRAKFLAEVK